jgi:hypothetical protein
MAGHVRRHVEGRRGTLIMRAWLGFMTVNGQEAMIVHDGAAGR